ncbi:Imidazolonepropionase [Candidatus Sulfotelmatomonas gaucii]|uniref:Imidazolonepropionase n=1 Tax=Candidatus Sulfuritelmatomonas gaucii TaxID=2043161 RepID=A0A2N9M6B5_9BACT|nr:Imidazolonepropionase [Candidatus Sulfotelmatomonas gaucii]
MKENEAFAIVNIGQLVTLAGPPRPRVGPELRELGMIPNAAILIEEGRIAAVGPYSEIQSETPPHAVVVDAQGRCVTPGFVDAHTHMIFAGNRAAEFEQRIAGASYQQIAAAGGGILSTVRATRAASEDELLVESRRHRDWMLRTGTTTAEAKSGYGLDRATELRMLLVMARLNAEGPMRIVPTLLAAHTVPEEFASRRAEYVRWIAKDLIPEVAALKLARFCDAFCDDHAFTIEEARTVLTAARARGLELRLHAEQFRPGTGAALAAELNARTADHLETATPEVLDALRAADVQPVLLPGSVFALSRAAYPPVRTMIRHGLAIVLATDFNPGSSPIYSMPFILSLACLQMALTPAEALTAATINAAWSLGLGDTVGSLKIGKQADLLIHEFADYRELPYFIASPARPRVFIAGQEAAFKE